MKNKFFIVLCLCICFFLLFSCNDEDVKAGTQKDSDAVDTLGESEEKSENTEDISNDEGKTNKEPEKEEIHENDTNIRNGFLYKVGKNYGFLNKYGEVVTEAVFSDVQEEFSDNGLLYVCANGRYGFLNENAEMVIERNYIGTKGFGEDGTACVAISIDKWGYIDENGEMVIGPVSFDTFCLADNFNKFGLSRVTIDNKVGLMNKKGDWVVYPEYGKIGDFSDNGLATISVFENTPSGKGDNQKYGVINSNGDIVVPLQYYYVSDFRNIYGDVYVAAVQSKKDDTDVYYIDSDGEIVTDEFVLAAINSPIYLSSSLDGRSICDNLRIMEVNKSYGIINTDDGNVVLDFEYEELSFFEDGMVRFKKDDLYGFVNSKGEMIIDECDFASYDTFLNCCRAEKDGKTHFINAKGEYILTTDKIVYSFSEIGLAVAREDNKYGYIDKSGNWVIQPKFLDAEAFSKEGYAVVSVETDYVDKYGIIDKNGNWVFEPIYDKKPELYGEIFYISEVGFLNKNGIEVISLANSSFSFECDNNLIVCKNGDLYDVYYKDGRMIGEGYDAVSGLEDRSYGYKSDKYITVWKNSKTRVIDANGEVINQTSYDDVWLMDNARRNY